MFVGPRFCLYGILAVFKQPLPLTHAFHLLHVNEEGLLGNSVSDGYTKHCLVGEFDFVGILVPLVDSFLDLIHYRNVRDGKSLSFSHS